MACPAKLSGLRFVKNKLDELFAAAAKKRIV